MKKFLSVILVLIMVCAMTVCLTACPGNTDNNEQNEPENNKIELTLGSWDQYLKVNMTMNPGTFKLDKNVLGTGAYGISGKGSAEIKIIPVQPIKCYNVTFTFKNLSPQQLHAYGIAITLGNVNDLTVTTDGYASCTTDITYKLTNYDDLRSQIMWGRGEAQIKEDIKNMQTDVRYWGLFGTLLKVEKVTGSITVE